MAHKNILFQNMQQQISRHVFENVMQREMKGPRPRKFSNRNQLDFMIYCILNQVKSLRDGIDMFNYQSERLYHIGFKNKLFLSTVSEANSNRNCNAYKELFEILKYDITRSMRNKINSNINIIDSTTITIDDGRVAWASYKKEKHGIKIHLMLEQYDVFPKCAIITPAKNSDIKIARTMKFEPENIYVMDRAYFDAKWLYKLHKQGVFFVTRLKKNIIHTVIQSKKLKKSNILEEKIIQFIGDNSDEYCEHVRAVTILDERQGKTFDVITNNFELSVEEIGEIYKNRWGIEIFLKWLKQNLKIKRFLGRSENAIKTQIWIALILYLLLWKMYHRNPKAYGEFINFLRYFKARMFMLDENIRFSKWRKKPPDNQLKLFEEKNVA